MTATLPSVRAVRVGASAGGLLSNVYERAFEATDSLPAISAPFTVKLVAELYSTSPALGVNVALRLPADPGNVTLKREVTSVEPANNFAVTTSSATLASMTPVAGVATTAVGVPGCAGAMVSRVSVTGVLAVPVAGFPAASSRVTPTVIVPSPRMDTSAVLRVTLVAAPVPVTNFTTDCPPFVNVTVAREPASALTSTAPATISLAVASPTVESTDSVAAEGDVVSISKLVPATDAVLPATSVTVISGVYLP